MARQIERIPLQGTTPGTRREVVMRIGSAAASALAELALRDSPALR